ncbi:MAG: response regulator transcription factor, partial [Anaerolineae bacterium]|nr:response regulator transcription factor [Anaerolineae bacterium]
MVRILVVDDDQKIVRLVRSYLEQAGYQVLTAFDGETALHTLRREKPDLVVLDLMLPDRDGWDITRIIRADATLAPTPVIMLTARVEDADKLTGLELGADDYITKPFNPREVVARVKAVLRRTSTGGAPPQLFQFDSLRIDLDRHEVLLDGQPLELTPTEFDLLKTLV